MYKRSKNVRGIEPSVSRSSVLPFGISDITARDIAGMILGAFLAYLMIGI
jgi:hypothetical protein